MINWSLDALVHDFSWLIVVVGIIVAIAAVSIISQRRK
jgi:uncharacterized membrane protein